MLMKIDKQNEILNDEQLLYQLTGGSEPLKAITKVKSEKVLRPKEIVRVTSAQHLTDEEKNEILEAIENVIPFDADKVQYHVEPSLIAGIRVQSSSYFYDNSLKRKLNDLDGHLHTHINID